MNGLEQTVLDRQAEVEAFLRMLAATGRLGITTPDGADVLAVRVPTDDLRPILDVLARLPATATVRETP